MINAIKGILCHKAVDAIRVENNGIEWELSVSSRSVDAIGKQGEEVRVLCWLLHKEDQMRLYGFADEAERAVFLQLLGVDGVGPKLAQKILSGIGARDLETALEAEDLNRLSSVPGLGKKTAQKLVFALKGKLPSSLADSKLAGSSAPLPGSLDDLLRALVEMGYDRKSASDALVKAESYLSGQKKDEAAEPKDKALLEQELFRRAIMELTAK